MALVYLLNLVFFVGATSAYRLDYVEASNSTLNSTLSEYPSIVQVESLLASGVWQHTCSASILNTRYVLSAASCFSRPESYLRRIRAGADHRQTGGVIIYVDKEYNYPGGNSSYQPFNDISVVRLARSLVYSSVIGRTVIPQAGSLIPNGLTLTQVGWGRGEMSNSLSSSAVVTVSDSACGVNAGNQTMFVAQNSTANTLCANIPGGFANSNADVGSPWFFGNITVGVVSGMNLGNNSSSGVISASSVAYYTSWIVSTAV